MSSAEDDSGITPIDHAADVGIAVRAGSLRELFSRAAAGMINLMLAGAEMDRTDGPSVTHEIEIEAADASALLVAWLRELLYLHTTQSFLYVASELIELDDRHVHARVTGVTWDEAGGREIKGVTYHGLHVANRDGEWHVRVIFDV